MEEKEIKINNSKLKIVQLNYSPDQNEVRVNHKTSLRYQFILMTDPTTNEPTKYWHLLDTYGKYKVKITPGNWQKAWILVQTKGIPNYTDETYSVEDIKTILAFIGEMSMNYSLEVIELLCHATGDNSVITKFYSSTGRNGVVDFKNLIIDILKDKSYCPKVSDRKWPLSYKSYRYSVQKLISDLVEDKASILVDPELVGEYENISGYYSNTEGLMKDAWCPIIGLLGNQERANISLKYITKTVVNIPENNLGIKSGEEYYDTIKSICLIKDGRLNHDKIGIRISGKLARKLKQLDIIKLELIYKNDYLIDLSSLPVISRDWLVGCSSLFLARLEAKKLYAKTILEYLDYISPVKEITEGEKFMQSIGIYDNIYCPTRTDEKFKGDKIFPRFLSVVKYYPIKFSDRKKNYIEYQKTKNCGNDNIKSFLDSIDFTQDYNELKNFWSKQYTEFCEEIRDRKFQLIMLKSGKFNDKVFIEFASRKAEITPGSNLLISWAIKN